jgi:hypothetical protein
MVNNDFDRELVNFYESPLKRVVHTSQNLMIHSLIPRGVIT